ncbi:MAG: hypothetical protein RL369_1727 [Pseudomonadota bacterium]
MLVVKLPSFLSINKLFTFIRYRTLSAALPHAAKLE